MNLNIKYLEENLLFRKGGEVYAYYEMLPFAYSYKSERERLDIFASFRSLILRSRSDQIDLIFVGVEDSIHDTISRSKELARGKLKDTAYHHLDGIEKHLVGVHGEYEVDFRAYIGFKLSENDYELSKGNIFEDFKSGIADTFGFLNKTLFNDYIEVSNAEIERYLKLEKLLYNKITRQLKMRRVEPKDYAYIIKHLNGQKGMAYDSYTFSPELKVGEKVTKIKTYDIVRLSDCVIEEKSRHLKLITEDETQYIAYLALSDITGELEFPNSSEIFYYLQGAFEYAVDVKMTIECVQNKKALSAIRNKKMGLKDLDESAMMSGNESGNNLIQARDDIVDLEAELEATKDNMFKVDFLLRINAGSEEELAKRVIEVKDYFNDFNFILQRPLGDQLGLHGEFHPGSSLYMNDYVQHVTADFIASLGFGASRIIGEKEGIYIGYILATGKSIYIQPWLAAQGVHGSVTNALAKTVQGGLGGGKSLLSNILVYYAILFGALGFVLDPKGDRRKWKEELDYLGDDLNLIEVVNSKENRGLLDPFAIMDNEKDAEELALNLLTYMTGISTRDSKRFPVLRKAISKVALSSDRKQKGLLIVIEELRKSGDKIAIDIAEHISSFADLSISGLLFGDGSTKNTLSMNGMLNVVMVQNLVLPDKDKDLDKYSVTDMVSVAILVALANFLLKFIRKDNSIYKELVVDEGWIFSKVEEGKLLINNLIRTGRHLNTAVDLVSQNCRDYGDEDTKEHIGMKFAFRAKNEDEIRNTLEYFNLEYTDENANVLRSLSNGECLFQDIKGNTEVIYVDYVFDDLFKAFDTRPPERRETED